MRVVDWLRKSKSRLRLPAINFRSVQQRRAAAVLCVLALSFTVRALTAEFMRAHLMDGNWFQAGTYSTFDNHARAILDGRAPLFWIGDAQNTQAAIYPPGYALWLALIYGVGGERSIYVVQNVQWVLDSLSVLLIIFIGVLAYNWRVGLIAGALAALSPLLAFYGTWPLADAPTSWLVLGGVLMLLVAVKRTSWRWALAAGAMIGASCWLRANALLLAVGWTLLLPLLLQGRWRARAQLAGSVALGALLLVAPIVIRNAVTFRAFLPTGLGLGTNLWEGIGETERAEEFGAVYGDDNLIERERVAMGYAPDSGVNLYWPDGVRRDRERARKAFAVIFSNPGWYAGVMVGRMWGVLNYTDYTSPIYGPRGLTVGSGKSLGPERQGGVLAFLVDLLGKAQDIWKQVALPLMVGGLLLALLKDWRMTGFILTVVLYYLVVGSFMHTEIRYGLPMQALLLVFAAFGIARGGEVLGGLWARRRRKGHEQASEEHLLKNGKR